MRQVEKAFRTGMWQVPQSVVVVTAAHEGVFRGVTAGSLASVSMEPSLVSFDVMHSSRMHDLITRVHRYAVHVLAEGQVSVSSLFAHPELTGEQQFAEVSHRWDADLWHGTDTALRRLCCLPDRGPYTVGRAGAAHDRRARRPSADIPWRNIPEAWGVGACMLIQE